MLERLLLRKHRLLKQIAVRDGPQPYQAPPPSPSPRAVKQTEQRRERRRLLYEQIVALHQQGASLLGIHRVTGTDPKTIRKYLKSDGMPEHQKRRRHGPGVLLSAFRDYLEQRWSEGCHNAVQLLAEIRALGYCGCYTTLRDFLQPMRLRVTAALPTAPEAKRRQSLSPSPRRLAWLLTNQDNRRIRAEETVFQDKIIGACPEVRHAAELAQHLCAIIRERRADELKRVMNSFTE